MSSNALWQLILFVVVLIALNFFFHLHISIIGSLLLTFEINIVMRMIRSN